MLTKMTIMLGVSLVVAGLFPSVVLGQTPKLEDVVRKHKKNTYDSGHRWMFVELDNVEQTIPQSPKEKVNLRVRQRISLIQSLYGPEIRIDLRQQRPHMNDAQYVTSADGRTYYSTRTVLSGDDVDKTIALTRSLGLTCRLLTWPTNAVYKIVPPRNRIDVYLAREVVKLHFDSKDKQLVSAEFTIINSGESGAFRFSEFKWRQGLRFPYIWHYSDKTSRMEGTFRVKGFRLLTSLDDSCFSPVGMSKNLREYMQDAQLRDVRKKASETTLTYEQRREIGKGLVSVMKEADDLDKKYEREPEKREQARKVLLDKWRSRLQEIKAKQ